MTRGLVAGLVSPHPLGERLPSLYQEDSLVQRMMAAFDQALAPIVSTLDNLEAYLDPELTPPDFLDWLGAWVGMASDESWPLERRREFAAAAADLYRVRGTKQGLARQLAIATGAEVEIEETGGTAWSTISGRAASPGEPGFALLVRLRVPDPSTIHLGRVDALVAAIKPAHVVHRVDLVGPES
jgi:phage tail-like protein